MAEAEVLQDGIYRHGNGMVDLVADGVLFTIEPLDWQLDFPQLEDHYVAARMDSDDPDFVNRIDRIKNPAMRKEFLDRAYLDMRKKKAIDRPTEQEIMTWMDTHDGVVYTFWLQLSKKTPTLKLQDVERILAKAGLAEAKARANLRDETNVRLTKLADAARAAGIDPAELLVRPEPVGSGSEGSGSTSGG